MLPFQVSDGGKGEIAERHDCTVRAVALIAAISYKEAHAILKKAGRKNGHTFKFISWVAGYGPIADRLKVFYTASAHNTHLTINQFVKTNPKGRYIVRTKGHVFAVIDGMIHDTVLEGGKRWIRNIWILEKF